MGEVLVKVKRVVSVVGFEKSYVASRAGSDQIFDERGAFLSLTKERAMRESAKGGHETA